MNLKFTLSLLLLLLLSTQSFSQSVLAAAPVPNNGVGGVFLTLTTNTTPVTINKFNTYFGAAAGANTVVEIYTRPGNYAGFTSSSIGWTLLGTLTLLSSGPSALTTINVSSLNIQIPANTIQSFYVHGKTLAGGLRYTSSAATTYSDANLQLFSNVAVATIQNTIAFGNSPSMGRTFAGSIEYVLSPLSLKWLDLSGKHQNGATLIQWEVEETDVRHYTLERQTAEGYTALTTINSKGNGRNSYQLTDRSAFIGTAPVAVYRIKQTDMDGRVSYSAAMEVRRFRGSHSIQVDPNPFDNSMQVYIQSKQTIYIIDATGKIISIARLNEGMNIMDTRNWLPGMYTMRTLEGETLKLMKR